MFRNWIVALLLAALAGCASLGPSPAQTQAVRIEGTPGMAVIYLVRTDPDLSYLATPVVIGDRMIGSTYAGTYYRVEVPAGRHLITGYAGDNGSLTIDVQADRVYFVQHTVSGSVRVTSPSSFFRMIDESRARAAMVGAQRLG